MSFLRRDRARRFRNTRLNAVKIPSRATFPVDDKHTQKRGDVNDVKPLRAGPREVSRAEPKRAPIDFEDLPA